jgi:hypothetical protein
VNPGKSLSNTPGHPVPGAYGFQLRTLRIVSTSSISEVRFRAGANVIAGASNTGKTYIFQCIRFALGGTQPPKPIPEASQYETVLLVIETSTGDRYTIERSLQGGDVRLHYADITQMGVPQRREAVIIGAEHDAKTPNNLSVFLLDLCGLKDKKISGKKRRLENLTFRDLREITLIDEQRIMSETSPVLSANYSTNSREKSVFNLLMSGRDDSSIIQVSAEIDAESTRRDIEKYNFLLEELSAQLPENVASAEQVTFRIERITSQLNQYTEQQSDFDKEIESKEAALAEVRTMNNRVQAKSNSNINLLARFDLLREKYQNDQSRLSAFDEVIEQFSHEVERNCPLCNSPLSLETTHHRALRVTPDVMLKAARAELDKTRILISHLQSTVDAIEQEQEHFGRQIQSNKEKMSALITAIEVERSPRIAQFAEHITALATERSEQLFLQSMLEREAQIRNTLTRLIGQGKSIPKVESQDNSLAIDGFINHVETLLKAWNYPELGRVQFDSKRTDLVLSGKDRRAHGKGFRALTFSAFVLGLLDYLTEAQKPRTGFSIIDSPLTTLKGRDAPSGEDVPSDVKQSFYASLASRGQSSQVIVLENDEPPSIVQSRLNYIHFSGAPGIGRPGFIQ